MPCHKERNKVNKCSNNVFIPVTIVTMTNDYEKTKEVKVEINHCNFVTFLETCLFGLGMGVVGDNKLIFIYLQMSGVKVVTYHLGSYFFRFHVLRLMRATVT
jgi:hypothetical protein